MKNPVKKYCLVLLLGCMSAFAFSQSCVFLGPAGSYAATTNGSVSKAAAPSQFNCFTGFTFRQVFWQYFYSPSGGSYVQSFSSANSSLDLDWVVLDAGTTAPPLTCPVSLTGMTAAGCSVEGAGGVIGGPGYEGAVNTIAGHYYLVGITSWQNFNAVFHLSTPTLGGAVLTAANFIQTSWSVIGNDKTNPSTNFIGTTDNQPLVIKTNNAEAIRILANGNTGIGNNNPAYKLDVTGNSRISALLQIGNSTSYPSNTRLALSGTNTMFHLSEGHGSGTPTLSIYNTGSTAKGISMGAGTTFSSIAYDNTGWFGLSSEIKSNIVAGTSGSGSGNVYYKLFGDGQSIFSSSNLTSTSALSSNVSILNTVAANKALIIRGASSQSGDLTQWQNNSGTVLAKINSAGALTVSGLTITGSAGAGKVLTSDAGGNATWQTVGSSSGWGLSGNSGTSSNNFIGTTDNVDLLFKTNNQLRMTLDKNGSLTGSKDISSKFVMLSEWGTFGTIGNTSSSQGLRVNSTGNIFIAVGGGTRTAHMTATGDFLLGGGSGEELSGISSNNGTNHLVFKANGSPGVSATEKMRLTSAGSLLIGKTSSDPSYKLEVNGAIHVQKVKVDMTGWADFVFDDNYRLPTLAEVETYISKNKHLPDVPSAEEVKKEGIDLGDNQAILLRKIEELTLYAIEQNKKIEKQQEQIDQLLKGLKK